MTTSSIEAQNIEGRKTPSRKSVVVIVKTIMAVPNSDTFNITTTVVWPASAFLILVAFAFINKRKSFRVKCFNGLPGPVVPVNLLDNYDNRLGFCLGFGALATLFFNMIINFKTFYTGSSKIIAALVLILSALYYGMIGFPLFACQSLKKKAVGSIVGSLYCILWFCIQITYYVTFVKHYLKTSQSGGILSLLSFMVILPQLICIFVLLIKFLIPCVKAIQLRSWQDSDGTENTKKYVLFYTKKLLEKREAFNPVNNGLKWKIKRLFYKWRPEFKYSTRIVCTYVVCFLIVYALLVSSILYLSVIFNILRVFPSSANISKGIAYASVCLTSIRSCALLFHMMSCYRNHVSKLRRGDRSWLPVSLQSRNASATSMVMASMRFSGLQIGFTVWGWILSFGVVSAALTAIFVMSFENVVRTWVFEFLKNLWPLLLLVIFIFLAQWLAVKFIFLRERGKILSLDNTNAFHIAVYFMFIYNVFFGFVSALSRTFRALIVSGILFEKVQSSVLPRSFEMLDPGYKAYLGYLLVEHAHANPVMQAFIFILKDHIADKYEDKSLQDSPTGQWQKFENFNNGDQQNSNDRSRIARNRWQLAYTLLRNPFLIEMRKRSKDTDIRKEDVEISIP